MTIPQPIIERLRKLMSLTESANQHEAALAAERMQAVMQEYNLTQADIGRGDEGPEDPTKVTREKRDHNATALYTYQRDLMAIIARNNFCIHSIVRRRFDSPMGRYERWDSETGKRIPQAHRKVHLLIGRSENVTAATLMYDYLTATMHRLLPFTGTDRRSTAARLWLAGCAEVLCERLAQQRTGAERSRATVADNTPGLVRLADLYGTEEDLNTDYRKGLEPGTTARVNREHTAELAAMNAKCDELRKGGMSYDEAWHRSRGYEWNPDTSPKQVAKETPSQQRRREQSEENAYYRSANREARERTQERMKRNNPSFRSGRDVGESIGLGGGLSKGDKSVKGELT